MRYRVLKEFTGYYAVIDEKAKTDSRRVIASGLLWGKADRWVEHLNQHSKRAAR